MYIYIHINMYLIYKIQSSFALISLNEFVLSENPYFATSPSPGACTCPSTDAAELTYDSLQFKELKTYFCAVFPVLTNDLNMSHQYPLAAEMANSRSTARRWERHW